MSRRGPVAARQRLAILVAVLAIIATACGSPATPALSDPKQILEAGIAGLQAAKSFHLDGTAAGKVVLTLGGSAATGSGAPISLDGSTLTGDADLAAKRASLSLAVPALFAVTADLVAVGGVIYTRVPFFGPGGWTRQPATGSIFDALADPAALLDGLVAFLDRPGVAPRTLSNERCDDADCYAVAFTIPAAEILGGSSPGAAGAGPGSSASAPGGGGGSAGALPGGSPVEVGPGGTPSGILPGGLDLGDVAITALVRVDTPRLVKLSVDVPLGAGGTVNLALALSKFGDPVTIEAPPDG